MVDIGTDWYCAHQWEDNNVSHWSSWKLKRTNGLRGQAEPQSRDKANQLPNFTRTSSSHEQATRKMQDLTLQFEVERINHSIATAKKFRAWERSKCFEAQDKPIRKALKLPYSPSTIRRRAERSRVTNSQQPLTNVSKPSDCPFHQHAIHFLLWRMKMSRY